MNLYRILKLVLRIITLMPCENWLALSSFRV